MQEHNHLRMTDKSEGRGTRVCGLCPLHIRVVVIGLETLLDLDQVHENIAWYHASLNSHGLRVRAHVKGHRLAQVTAAQIIQGASGVVAQTAREARHHLSRTTASSVVLARPSMEDWRLRAAAGLSMEFNPFGIEVIVQVSDFPALQILSREAWRIRTCVRVRLEVEVGADRGFSDEHEVLTAAEFIRHSGFLTLEGLSGYYSPADKAEVETWAHHARQAARLLVGMAQVVRDADIDVPTVSVGGTLNGLYASGIPGITEITAGAYALGDAIVASRSAIVPALIIRAAIGATPGTLEPSAKQVLAATFNDWDEAITITTPSLEPLVQDTWPTAVEAGSIITVIPSHICPLMLQSLEIKVQSEGRPLPSAWTPQILTELQQ